MNNVLSNSYSEIDSVSTSDIPQLVSDCLETGVNLLIYGEAGSGKSTIIESLRDSYYLVQLGAASLCEEMINGIPVHDSKTNSISYDMPEWLREIKRNHSENSERPQILFIDELTLARPEVMNSLQLLLTARAVPTHPNDILPDNVVIVSATNTVEETNEGCELSRPLKTRFMTVRMTNTPERYESYVLSKVDEVMPDIKELLGEEMTARFVSDSIKDFSEYWCDNSRFYGTNPRTIMNYFKMCNQSARTTGEFKPSQATTIARRTVGHNIATTSWYVSEINNDNKEQATKQKTKTIYPTTQEIEMSSDSELEGMLDTIARSPKANTKQAFEAMLKINIQLHKNELARKKAN